MLSHFNTNMRVMDGQQERQTELPQYNNEGMLSRYKPKYSDKDDDIHIKAMSYMQ